MLQLHEIIVYYKHNCCRSWWNGKSMVFGAEQNIWLMARCRKPGRFIVNPNFSTQDTSVSLKVRGLLGIAFCNVRFQRVFGEYHPLENITPYYRLITASVSEKTTWHVDIGVRINELWVYTFIQRACHKRKCMKIRKPLFDGTAHHNSWNGLMNLSETK